MDVQHELEGQGLYPTPTIHGDDGLEWMRQYIDEGHVLLGIGRGSRWGSRIKMLPYLDRVFNLAEKRGVLLHGFAVTDVELMLRFPWYSVDSISWA